MWDINERDFRRVDLNALLVFTALMRERSVSRAAARLFLGQPAVSMALKRLRTMLGDELFVRTRAGMEPTARALVLYESIGAGLCTIHAGLTSLTTFDAAKSEAAIRIGMPDDLETIILPRLAATFAKEAPRMRLIVRPADFRDSCALLDAETIDLAITAKPVQPDSWHDLEILGSETFLCVYSRRQLKCSSPITRKQYLSARHILVSQSGELHGAIDRRLATLGLARNVVAAAARFSVLPDLLRRTPALANVPSAVARHFGQTRSLAVSELPFEAPSFEIAIVSHARIRSDPAIRWSADRLRDCWQSLAVNSVTR
jgi:LysR family transcriptional regulator, mexEF-oprN operon transcriptional activator